MVRTENEIYQSLKNKGDYNGFIDEMDFQDDSRIDLMYAAYAAEMFDGMQEIQNEVKESILVTAERYENVFNLAAPYYSAILKTQSKAIAKFIRDGTVLTDIFIPRGTFIETAEVNPMQFVTLYDKWIYEGQDFVKIAARSIKYGSETMIKAGELCVVTNNLISGVDVINELPSWGGRDGETVNEIKRGAFSAKYTMERGNRKAIINALKELGIDPWRYNLVEFEYGEGSGAFFLDTEVNEELEDAKNAILETKGDGIYGRFEIATKIEIDFSFNIEISATNDILPNTRDSLLVDLNEAFETAILLNGVGQKLMLSKVVNYLFDNLLSKYEISDINISTPSYINKQDERGNIILENFEVIKVANVTVDINVVG